MQVVLSLRLGVSVKLCSHLTSGDGDLPPQFSAWLPNILGFMPHFFISRTFYGLSKKSIEIHLLKPLLNVGRWVWGWEDNDPGGSAGTRQTGCSWSQPAFPVARAPVSGLGAVAGWSALGWTGRLHTDQSLGSETAPPPARLRDRQLLFPQSRAF